MSSNMTIFFGWMIRISTSNPGLMSFLWPAVGRADAPGLHEEDDVDEAPLTVSYERTRPDAFDLTKGKQGDAGHDIAVIAIKEVLSRTTALYETRIRLAIPEGYFVLLVPRSSIARRGYFLTNSVGIIDPGYRGTLAVSLTKISADVADLKLPCPIAQLIVMPITPTVFLPVASIPVDPPRREGGFGSTGLLIE
jgi:dUTP pyrophosphatase